MEPPVEEEIQEIPVELTDDLERRIAEVFVCYDNVGNKTIDTRDLGNVLRSMGCCPTDAEILEMAIAVGTFKHPGLIHLAHLLPHLYKLLMDYKFKPASADELLNAFRYLDPDNRGYVTKEELTTAMTEYGEPLNDEELEEMLLCAVDPYTKKIPYEYYINQLLCQAIGEKDIYRIVDRMWIENPPPPPPPPPKTMSEMLAEMGED